MLKSTAVAALMFISFTSMAYEPSINLVNGIAAKSLVFEMVSTSKETVVSLNDSKANILFYDDVTDKNYAKKSNVFDTEGKKVRLNLSNKDLNNVDIKIINQDKAKVFGETLTSQANIDKTFNFEKAIRGNYIISVKDGNKVYYQNIRVD